MTPTIQTTLAAFARDHARPGRRYRARIGGGRIVEIQDGQVFEGSRVGRVGCLAWSAKRIVALEEMVGGPPPLAITKGIAR